MLKQPGHLTSMKYELGASVIAMRFGVARQEELAAPAGSRADLLALQEVEKPRADGLAGRRRFRAPSVDGSATSSDDEDAPPASALATLQLTAKSRQELVTQVERACERKAVQAVTGSGAYRALVETLQRARQDAEAQLRRLDLNADDADKLRQQQLLEKQASTKLQQVRGDARDGGRQEADAGDFAADSVQGEELQEAKEKEEAEKAKRKAAQEVEEAQAKAKAQAAERAAAQKKQEAEREKEQAEKKAAEKEAAAQAKKYVKEGHARIKRLEELHRHTTEILDSPDPSVKKIRMQIRREVSVYTCQNCSSIGLSNATASRLVHATKLRLLLPLSRAWLARFSSFFK
ncbi:unnamed protein product [Phytophthora lilii]|uniref:Unnamed protein product n=1 Tax=Phytophthora lilii TaxID=2077276 RepID=A0A9W6WMZ7_9STRA|nr:unnamed protein product [Phytophthora lilii]